MRSLRHWLRISTEEAQLLPMIQLFHRLSVKLSFWQTHIHTLVEEFQRHSEMLKR